MEFVKLPSGYTVKNQEICAFKTKGSFQSYTYLMAGTHGDEPEGVYVVQKLFEWLKEENPSTTPLVIIPVLNMDGYKEGTRVNANGVDLNRNYPSEDWTPEIREPKYNPGNSPLSEPENKFLDKLFQNYSPHLILSIHSWKPFINYNGDCKNVAEFLAKYNGYEIMGEIDGHPTPGSLGNYGPEKYSAPVLTFECPVVDENTNLDSIWKVNEEAFKNLLKSQLVLAKKSHY